MSNAAAPYGLEQWLEFLQDKPLPIRVSTRKRLHALLTSDSSNLMSLVPVVRTDPVLSLQLAREAQRLHAIKGSQVSGISHVVQSLGFEAITECLRTLRTLRLNAHSVRHKMFYRATADSFHASTQAHAWVTHKKLPAADEISLAAQLYGFIHWVMWFYAPLHKEAYQRKVYVQKADVALAEYDVFGCTLQELGFQLSQRWNLPPLVSESLDHATSPSAQMLEWLHLRAVGDPQLSDEQLRSANHFTLQRLFPVKLSNWLALTTTRGWQTSKARRLYSIISHYLALDEDTTLARLHSLCAQAARDYHVPGVLLPATELLMLRGGSTQVPGQLSDKERQQLEEPFARLRTATPPRQPNATPSNAQPNPPKKAAQSNGEQSLAQTLLDPAQYQTLLKNLGTPGCYSHPSALLKELLRGLTQGVGLKRVAVMQIKPPHRLQTIFSAGFEARHGMNDFTLDAEIPSLFKRMCGRSACIWFNDQQRTKLEPLLPDSFRPLQPRNDFLLMSLFFKQRPLALIYADMGHEAAAMSELHPQHFRTLCTAATAALNRLAQEAP